MYVLFIFKKKCKPLVEDYGPSQCASRPWPSRRCGRSSRGRSSYEKCFRIFIFVIWIIFFTFTGVILIAVLLHQSTTPTVCVQKDNLLNPLIVFDRYPQYSRQMFLLCPYSSERRNVLESVVEPVDGDDGAENNATIKQKKSYSSILEKWGLSATFVTVLFAIRFFFMC